MYAACPLCSKRADAQASVPPSSPHPDSMTFQWPWWLAESPLAPCLLSRRPVLRHPTPPTHRLQTGPLLSQPPGPGRCAHLGPYYTAPPFTFTACFACQDCSFLGPGPSSPLTPHHLPDAPTLQTASYCFWASTTDSGAHAFPTRYSMFPSTNRPCWTGRKLAFS